MTFRFGLISDAHFGPRTQHRGKLRKMGDRAAALTRAFVTEMNDAFDPDVVVNLGDVVEDEGAQVDRRRYEEFLDCLAPLRAPVLHVAGNHESVHLDDASLLELWGRTGALHYTADVGPLTFVILRTVQHRQSIELPEPQITWLDGVLTHSTRPVVLLMHHPLSEQILAGNRWFEDLPYLCRVANRRQVRSVIERHDNVIAVFNGHVHWNHLDIIGGRPYVTVQSLTENVHDDAPGKPAAAWACVTVDRRRMHIDLRGAEPQRVQVELAVDVT